MKRVFLLCAMVAFTFSSCSVNELENINIEHMKMKSEKNENKKNVDFEIFKDRTQIGADWRK